jgi:hypothetical protein
LWSLIAPSIQILRILSSLAARVLPQVRLGSGDHSRAQQCDSHGWLGGREHTFGYIGGSALLNAAAEGLPLKMLASFDAQLTYDIIARPEIKTSPT